jgi:hypothetical protein
LPNVVLSHRLSSSTWWSLFFQDPRYRKTSSFL